MNLRRKRPPQLSITSAGLDEASILAELHQLTLGQNWQPHEIENVMGNNGTLALVARMGDEPCGFILFRSIAGEGEILNMGVKSHTRQQGIGHALLRDAINTCAEAGCEYLWLEVAEDNQAALHLYQSHGFTQEGKRKGYYRKPDGITVDAHILRLTTERSDKA